MAHNHSHHGHHHVDPDAGDMRVALAVGVNLLLTVAQVVGGVLAGFSGFSVGPCACFEG